MNKRRTFKDMGRTPVIVGCLALIIAVAAAQTALAQQAAPKVETITLNWASFLPGSHPEMIAFNKGFVDKAVELSKGRLAFKFRGGPETIALMDLPRPRRAAALSTSPSSWPVL